MITICLATYNGEKYLAQQIDSILAQTFEDWALLVHDDNSDDKTVSIIKQYQKKYPQKINFIEDEVSYGSASKNFAFLLEQTKSEYIMFCDQDDIWLDIKIEDTFDKMRKMEKEYKKEAIMVFTDLMVVDKSLKTINKSLWSYQKLNPKVSQSLGKILAQNVVTGSTIMLNKKAKEVSSPMVVDKFVHDHFLAINICKYGKIFYVNKSLVKYRQHSINDLGAIKITTKYFLSKISNFINCMNRYKTLNFSVSIRKILFWKIYLNLQRLF